MHAVRDSASRLRNPLVCPCARLPRPSQVSVENQGVAKVRSLMRQLGQSDATLPRVFQRPISSDYTWHASSFEPAAAWKDGGFNLLRLSADVRAADLDGLMAFASAHQIPHDLFTAYKVSIR